MRTPEAVSAMLCPVCKVGLAMSDRQGIEIDYCPQCRGIWLDRGELDKIIERSAAPAAAPQQAAPPPQQQKPWAGHDRYSDDRYHGGHQDPRYYKKRKSWLEEIFD
ncbi:zf-TFIIB domain-containing protein [Sphingomonas sp. LaA6.9]|uniref:TFIIB-type zinc ribbon-containing protein n=1 Tax=Sphingomonas sp. LaA6.9 TaxID=2919914 RepID=UPI001F4F6A14|nr:zf-TFIIB domain-containing protein [Sphingomonas sp. LaA6.9]MCJ8159377.1 zf-TFIIB domain-containing protein [Sphingomonas sp. LaA6.9]